MNLVLGVNRTQKPGSLTCRPKADSSNRLQVARSPFFQQTPTLTPRTPVSMPRRLIAQIQRNNSPSRSPGTPGSWPRTPSGGPVTSRASPLTRTPNRAATGASASKGRWYVFFRPSVQIVEQASSIENFTWHTLIFITLSSKVFKNLIQSHPLIQCHTFIRSLLFYLETGLMSKSSLLTLPKLKTSLVNLT
jgi:hypothetical protein